MRSKELIVKHVMWVWICVMVLVASGCGSSGSASDPDVDTSELQFSFRLISHVTGEPTDAISQGNPGVLQVWVTYKNQKNNPPASGNLVTVSTTKGAFSVSADGTDMTDADGLAEISLAPVDEDGEVLTGAGEITVTSGDYTSDPFAFQIGVPDDIRLGAIKGEEFQEGLLAVSLAEGEILSYGGTTLIMADLVDAWGMPFDQPVTVKFSSQCGATLTSTVIAENGQAVCIYTSNGCTNDQDVVTATVLRGGTDLTAAVSIPLARDAAGFIEFVSVDPANIAVAGTATPNKPEISQVTFRLKDNKGNIMPRETVLFSLTNTQGGVTVSPLNRETDENGEVTALVKSGDTATQVRVKAVVQNTTVSTLSGNISIEETPISESIGSISMSVGNLVVPADGQSRVTVRATVLDRSGQPLPAVAVDFTTTLGTMSTDKAWTRSDGMAEVQLQSFVSGTALVTANAHGYLAQTPINITPGGPMNLELLPAIVDDGTIETEESRVYHAILRDNEGNPIANEQINFYFEADGNVSGGSLNAETGITNASGIARVTYTAGTDIGVDEIKAVTNTNMAVFNTLRVEVVQKQVTVGSLIVSAEPEVLSANGVSSSAITALARDITGAPVPRGTTIVFSTSLGIFSNGGTTLTVNTQDASGGVTVSLTASITQGIALVAAASGGVSRMTSVSFEEGNGSVVKNPAFISLSTSKTSILTNGLDSAVITARVLDINRVPVEGSIVSFSTAGQKGNGGQITASSVETDANGDAAIELSSGNDTLNDLATITAYVANLDSVTIPIQMTGSSVELSVEATSLNVDDTALLTVFVSDGGDLPVFNAGVVTEISSDGIIELSPERGNTGVGGTMDILVTGKVSGESTVTVNALGDEKTVTFTVRGDPFEIIHFGKQDSDPGATSPVPVESPAQVNFTNTNDQIYIQIRTPDAHGVRLSTTMGFWVDAAVNDGSTIDPGTPVSPGSTKTIIVNPAPGKTTATAVLDMGTIAGRATLRVEDEENSGINDGLSIAISAPSVEAAKINLQVAPSVIAPSTGPVINSATLSATVLNSADQVVADAPVVFTLFRTTGGGEFIAQPIVYTDELGKAETTFSSGSLVSDAKGVYCMARIVDSVVAGPGNDFSFFSVSDSITRSSGDFTLDGFSANPGNSSNLIAVTGSVYNDGEYTISVPPSDDTLELNEALLNEAPGADLVIRTRDNTDVVSVVISGQASSIAIGGATVVEEYGPSTYRYPMSVLVADSNGNPVEGAIVNLSLWPTTYYTGVTDKDVGPVRTWGYLNEDENRNQILDSGEDTDAPEWTASNGILDPAKSAAGTVPATVVTDANGVGQFDYIYQKNYSGWLDVEVRATALVYGSETTSSIEFPLGYAESEKGNIPSSPWGPGSAD